MPHPDSAANRIRDHLGSVNRLRAQAHSEGLSTAVHQVKELQALRFRATYMDFLSDPRYIEATRFFLDELYGEHDFAQRDEQFGRIAVAIEKLFPAAVAELAVDLAEAHALTETLDHAMATHWMEQESGFGYTERYLRSWRLTGERDQRERQLAVVQHMGRELQRLTRKKSLMIALRMMRGPAQAAGLASLQLFLERGFAAFAQMGDASQFLAIINEREQRWIQALFDDDLQRCSMNLAAVLSNVSSPSVAKSGLS